MNSPPVNSLGTSLVTSFKQEFPKLVQDPKARLGLQWMMGLSPKIQTRGLPLQQMHLGAPSSDEAILFVWDRTGWHVARRVAKIAKRLGNNCVPSTTRFAMMVAMGEAEMRKNNPVAALSEMMDTIDASPKTVVAALNGPALGGGCEVSCKVFHCAFESSAPCQALGHRVKRKEGRRLTNKRRAR
ncbi:ehhadh [Symbiodinium sp. CCMP2456]|nr:ehhadh [Symbiodinium sp. CCMP2456]